MSAFLVVEAGKLSPMQQLCFKHLAAYCIIGTMSGARAEGSVQLCNQITAFLNFCRLEKGLAANSLDAYSTDLARFKEFIGDSVGLPGTPEIRLHIDRKSTRLNSSHLVISYAVFCLKNKKKTKKPFKPSTIPVHDETVIPLAHTT